MTQVWDSDDPFSDSGLTQASSYLDHIARHTPWTTDPAHSAGGTGFSYQSTYFGTRSQLYNGWFNQSTGAIQHGASALPAAVSSGSISAIAPKPIAFWRRDTLRTDVRVATSFQIQATDPSYMRSNAVTFMVGVGARIVPGANTSPTDPNLCATAAGSGYWLVVMHDTTLGLGTKFQILRVNAGTVTRLTETPIGPSSFLPWGQGGVLPTTYWRPMKIELHVSDEGGNVRLIAYTTAEGGSHGGVRRELFNLLDSSASKLTAAGVTGLLCGSEFIATLSPQRVVAPCVNFWEATTPDEATVYFRDEWSRTKHSLGLFRSTTTSGDKAHFPGYSLMSGWCGDTQTAMAVGPWLTLDTTNDRVTVAAASKPPSILSMRPADDARVQDRAATFRFTSTGSSTATERYAGIGVRGTIAAGVTGAFAAGYIARLYFKDSTSGVRLTIVRVVAEVETVIAEKSAPIAFALDSNITLRLAIETLPVPDPVNGYAVLRVYLNGSQVAVVAPTVPVLGIDISAAGVVTDSSSSRVLAGLGEAILVWAPTGTRSITFDAWTQESGTEANDLPENDQATIPVVGEYASTVGDLELPVSTRATVRYVDPRIEHVMESRHRYLGRRLSYARRVWTVTANGATQAEVDALLAQLDLGRGTEAAFDWTPPGLRQDPVVVHFMNDTIDYDLVAPGVYSVRFELQELRLQDA